MTTHRFESAPVHYRSAIGERAWWIATRQGALAALAPDVTPHTADAVWRRLGQGGIGAVLDALTSAFGTSLTAIPSVAFAVVEDGGVRVAVRGAFTVVVDGADGPVAVSGEKVSTWSEQFVTGALRATLAPSGAAVAAEEAVLPLESGVVRADLAVLTVARESLQRPVTAPVVSDSVRQTEPVPASEPVPAPEPDPEPDPEPEAEPEQAPVSAVASAETWMPAATLAPEASDQDDVSDDYDLLWGATIARPITAAIPAEVAADEPAQVEGDSAAPASEETLLGDHDGKTISVAEARALRAAEHERFESTDGVPPRRPPRGRIVLSTGRVVELERPVVIGRRPRSTRASDGDLPVLVAVDSPDQDISRSHVEIRSEGVHVLVTDLHTTNGTLLRRGAQDPVHLHAGEPTMVVTGDLLDLGDGVTVLFEDLP